MSASERINSIPNELQGRWFDISYDKCSDTGLTADIGSRTLDIQPDLKLYDC
jgi:hypothetical protein